MTTAEQQRAAIERWQRAMRSNVGDLQIKYAMGMIPVAELRVDAEKWSAFATAGLKLNADAFRESAMSLGGIALHLKDLKGDLSANHTLVRTFIKSVSEAVDAFIRVGRPALATVANTNAIIEKVVNAPSTLVKWTLEQTLASVGIPKWGLPVIGGAVIVGLGLWAYATFLAPVSRARKYL